MYQVIEGESPEPQFWCCIVDVYYCCVVDRHCFFFPARLWYVLHVSHKLISSAIWKLSRGTEEKRGTTFRNSTDEIFETLTWNNKTI
jgi:hypothetical protein